MREPFYSVDTTTDVFLACCILHNYLMGVDPDYELIEVVDRELMGVEQVHESNASIGSGDEDATLGVAIRNNIATTMWQAYVSERG